MNNLNNEFDLSKNDYFNQIIKMTKESIRKYKKWRSNNELTKNVITRIVEPMIYDITPDKYNVEFIKKILRSEFPELNYQGRASFRKKEI